MEQTFPKNITGSGKSSPNVPQNSPTLFCLLFPQLRCLAGELNEIFWKNPWC
jgi:hypothetical protein